MNVTPCPPPATRLPSTHPSPHLPLPSNPSTLLRPPPQAPPASPADIGYSHVFAQLYQAYEPRYSPEALAALYGSSSSKGKAAAAAAAQVRGRVGS